MSNKYVFLCQSEIYGHIKGKLCLHLNGPIKNSVSVTMFMPHRLEMILWLNVMYNFQIHFYSYFGGILCVLPYTGIAHMMI